MRLRELFFLVLCLVFAISTALMMVGSVFEIIVCRMIGYVFLILSAFILGIIYFKFQRKGTKQII